MTAIELPYILRPSLRASFLNGILEIPLFGKSDTYITEKIEHAKSLTDTK